MEREYEEAGETGEAEIAHFLTEVQLRIFASHLIYHVHCSGAGDRALFHSL